MRRLAMAMLSVAVVTAMLSGCGETPVTGSTSSSTLTPVGSTESTVAQTTAIDTTFSNRDSEASYTEASAVKITCSGDTAEISGKGATYADGVLTITDEGTYLLSGTLDGMIVVEAADTAKIQLVLNGISVQGKTSPALYIKQADKVFVTLVDGSKNVLKDAEAYSLSADESNVDGTIFSKADLTINGSGELEVTGNYQHGIVSKDDLVITSGTITVSAKGQGLYGKDCVKIKDGTFLLTTGGDAIQSDNTEDTARGYVYISSGTFEIESDADGIQAETVLQIDGGTFSVTTGGGSANSTTTKSTNSGGGWGGRNQEAATTTIEDTPSTKALKSGTQLLINGGSFQLDSSDDSLHTNGDLTLNGGDLTISSGDDGIHADSAVYLKDGKVLISQSYEGIEGSSLTFTGGEYDVTASDDGVNAAGGNDGSSLNGRPGQNNFSANSDQFIRVSGGILRVTAGGDGLDSNGALYIEGGETYVNGPTSGGDSALDCDGAVQVTGGIVVAAGSAGMVQGFGDTSTQCSILWQLGASVKGGTALTLKDADGNEVVSYTPTKDYQAIVLSSPKLVQGSTYTLTAGTETSEITLESVVTSNSQTQGMGGHGGGKGGFGANGTAPDGSIPEGTPPDGVAPDGTPPTGSRPERPNGSFGGRGQKGQTTSDSSAGTIADSSTDA